MDARTKQDIEKRAWIVLSEAGLTEPPIEIDEVIAHLKLHLDYYSLEDPSFLKRLSHKFNINAHKVSKTVKDLNLVAAWYPDSSKILLDRSLPLLKQTFPKYHEVVHSILPWHKEFFRGDTAQTLHPEYHDALEYEANYGASELWLCGPEFRRRLVDYQLEWKSIKALKEMFGATLTTTFWKYVVSQKIPVLGSISTPAWIWDGVGESRCKHLMSSASFSDVFSPVDKSQMLNFFEDKIVQRRGGPLGTFSVCMRDRNGALHEFRGETHSNTYDLLTLLVHVRKMDALISVG